MNMFNLSAGRDFRKNAGSLSVILTGGATDKPCNCFSYIRTPSLKYTNSITQIYELYHSNIRTPSLNAKSNPLPTHLTQSCLRLCRAHCLDFPIVSVCRDATEAPVGKVTVAKDRPIIYSGPRRPQKGPISWTNGPIDDCFATGRWLWRTCGRGSRDKSVDRRWSRHA